MIVNMCSVHKQMHSQEAQCEIQDEQKCQNAENLDRLIGDEFVTWQQRADTNSLGTFVLQK